MGTMGIKLAKALGNDVMAISTSANKEQLAKEKGATMFACSKDPESMKAHAGKCDLILNTSMLTFIIISKIGYFYVLLNVYSYF